MGTEREGLHADADRTPYVLVPVVKGAAR